MKESIQADSEIQRNLLDSKETEVIAATKSRSPKIIQSSKKNAGEAKCDVLNELLSNFSSIKLKPVSTGRRTDAEDSRVMTVIHPNDDEEEELDESRMENRSGILRNKSDGLQGESSKYRNLEEISSVEQKSEGTKSKASNSYDEISRGIDERYMDLKEISLLDQKSHSDLLKSKSKVHDGQLSRRSSHEQKSLSDNSNQLKSEKAQTSRTDLSRSLKTNEISTNCRQEIVRVDVHRSEMSKNDYHPEPSEFSVSPSTEVRTEPGEGETLAKIADARIHAESLQIVDRSEKTDAKAEEKPGHGVKDERSDCGEQLALKRTGSEEKCAIARRIPRPHCTNNDNNRAVTPVAVSDDQSRETIAITPGRVRSFVKYYEIRRETTTDKDSKSSDKDKADRVKTAGHQSVFSIRRGPGARARETPLDTRKDHFEASAMTKSSEKLTDCESRKEASSREMLGTEQRDTSRFENRDPRVLEDLKSRKTDASGKSCGESGIQSGKVKRKKSVKFQGGYTVIGAKGADEDGSAGSFTNQDVKSTGKRKAPDRPTMPRAFDGNLDPRAEVFVDAEPCSVEKREITAQVSHFYYN